MNLHLVAWTDASYGNGNDVDAGRSTGGHLATLGGGALAWRSRVMRTVALSTVEAEYMAAAEAAKEVIWLRGILSEMGFPQEEPM